MNTVVFSFAAFLLSAVAAAYGMLRFFHKGRPLYFQLMVLAAACFSLTQLWYLVMFICDNPGRAGIGLLGFAGCSLFLLSANWGQLDGLVDDRSIKGVRERRTAHAAPCIMALLMVVLFLVCFNRISDGPLIAMMILCLPSLPASYYSLKHALMPIDNLGFLKATRACNISALFIYPLSCICLMMLYGGMDMGSGIVNVLIGIVMIALVASSERGMKIWKTLI